jgi:hypothetical protein
VVESADDVQDIYRFCGLIEETKDSFGVFSMSHHQKALRFLKDIPSNPDAVLFTSLFEQNTPARITEKIDSKLLENPIFKQYLASSEFANHQRFHTRATKLQTLCLVCLLERYQVVTNKAAIVSSRPPWISAPSDESLLDLYLLYTPLYENNLYHIHFILACEYDGADSTVVIRKMEL